MRKSPYENKRRFKMKTKKYLFIPFLLAILISSLFANVPVKPAFAQEQCVDASGAPIPCPPTAEIPCGQPGGPACPPTKDGPNPTPRPTRTSQPIANPTEETSTAGASWSGSCANAGPVNDPCLLKLMDACYDAGGDSTVGNADENGTVTVTCALPAVRDPNAPRPLVSAPTRTPLPDENYLGSCSNNDRNIFDCFEKFTCEDGLLVIKVDLYSGNGTKYDFYCIPDESTPLLDLPLSLPDPKGKVANWTGGCSAGAGLDACLDLMSAGCAEEGGDVSIWYDDDGGAGVYCENQSEASQPAPDATPLPLAAADPTRIADGDWVGGCNFGDNYDFCMDDYKAACNNEGGVYNESHDDEGTNVSCSDTTAGRPNGGFPGGLLPWAGGGIVGILIGLLVPAIQKVREAAARTKTPSREHILLNKVDGGTEAHIKKAVLHVRKAGGDQQDSPQDPEDDTLGGWDVKANKKI
jgi:hypothetical protein